jgi:hypothetical protein
MMWGHEVFRRLGQYPMVDSCGHGSDLRFSVELVTWLGRTYQNENSERNYTEAILFHDDLLSDSKHSSVTSV